MRLRCATLLLLLISACSDRLPDSAPPSQPVVVLITVANLRADLVDLEDERGLTPRLAALARQASFAAPAVAGSSSELPALASLLSGLSPSDHGVWGWELGRVGRTTLWLPDRLATADVVTQAWVGRPVLAEDRGWSRGFGRWQQLGRLRSVRAALAEPEPGSSFTWIDLPGTRPPWHLAEIAVPDDPDRDALPMRLDPAELSRTAAGDWFGAAQDEATVRSLYRHALATVDGEIGDLVDAALSGSRAADTTVIVTSDCGYRLGEDGRLGVGHGQDRVDVLVPLLILGRELPGIAGETEPSLLSLAPAIGSLFGLPSIPAWRSPASPALIETPVSNGWRAGAAVGEGFQLRRQQRWGDPAPDLLHPDALSSTQLRQLLSLSASEPYQEVWRVWTPHSNQVVGEDEVPPAVRSSLTTALDRLTAPRPGRLAEHRRLIDHPSRGILPQAPDNGASGP